MPVVMRPLRLLEAFALAGERSDPSFECPGLFQNSIDGGGSNRHYIGVKHHEGGPAIAVGRVLGKEINNGFSFPVLEPIIPGNP